MPEGDTIHRTAASLQRWIGGREVTAARSPVVDATRLVGRQVGSVEARGKHLLVHFAGGVVLHTHMRMTGSWHVYPAGDRWRQPAGKARIVLQAGDRTAVCFSAPVVEVLSEARAEQTLARLGPDVIGTVEPAVLRRRAAARAFASPTVGELLLDQQVVSGIGNVYRCEALFLCGVDPHRRSDDLDPETLRAVVSTASRLMAAATASASGRRDDPAVYRRTGRPCRRCGTPVRSERFGREPRTLYWCPGCQG